MRNIIACFIALLSFSLCFAADGGKIVLNQGAKISSGVGGGVPVVAASIAVVTAAHNHTDWGNPVVVTISPTAGNLLVIVIGTTATGANTVSTIRDNNANAYEANLVFYKTEAGTNSSIAMYYGAAVTGCTTITVTLSGDAVFSVVVYEVSGASTYGESDSTSNTTALSPSPDLANTTNNSIYFAILGYPGTALTINSEGTDGTWTQHAEAYVIGAGLSTLSVPYIIVSSAATRGHTWASQEIWKVTGIATFH